MSCLKSVTSIDPDNGPQPNRSLKQLLRFNRLHIVLLMLQWRNIP